jgi:hypothetical protein
MNALAAKCPEIPNEARLPRTIKDSKMVGRSDFIGRRRRQDKGTSTLDSSP